MNSYEKLVRGMLSEANIPLGGKEPYAMQVRDPKVFHRIVRDGTLGLGETYMEGAWDTDDLVGFMARFSSARLSEKFRRSPSFLWNRLRARLANEGDQKNALAGVRRHYDIGNDLFQAMLDPRMVYTCAYWNEATTLAEAQEAKLELLCRKLDLRPGMRVLDIGCGWGSFLKYAAEKYGIQGVGVSNSREQIGLARELCRGLPIEFREQDYRDVSGSFDRVLSVGMFEHVCYKNHRTYMEVVHRCLVDGGISVLHTMGRTKSMWRGNDQWITKYIFPNTQVPSVAQVGQAIDGLFVMEDWENLSTDYERTLLAWHDNFARNWPGLRDKYGDTFYRMWTYYLKICAGWYRSRRLQLWQVVLAKGGVPGGYHWQKQRKPLGMQ
jgi:cyclopropane-fatty-acyl-phospholipid synthase